MQPATREADVQLGRETPIEVKLDPKTVTETVTVTAESSMVDRTSPTLTNGLSADQMKGLPIGQDYRDLIRFIPGVQDTPDTTRGPSAGGQRPGQRVQVRRRERHAAALRHPVG